MVIDNEEHNTLVKNGWGIGWSVSSWKNTQNLVSITWNPLSTSTICSGMHPTSGDGLWGIF
ncbi:hypothetical protein DAMA08_046890 [Martiniozyma asiatica (nom. inval.)]|nr:hypothetical protein DAMA08_046890 [Martiniozyma asiatica]